MHPDAVDGVILRDAGPADSEALALVAAATCLETFAGTLPGDAIVQHCARYNTPSQMRRYLEHPRTRAWLAVASEGGAPIGYAMLTEPDLPVELGEADLELRRIYLFSRFQGTGVGQRLMDTSISGAYAMGAPRLLLGVYGENLRALHFYERNGFRRVGTRKFTVGNLVCDDFVLGRALP